jgi:mRNA-degrading endonuclease RelE of RelBE toxin-antitoxin system
MELLFESTQQFERDLEELSKKERATVIRRINLFATQYPNRQSSDYAKLEQPPFSFDLKGYDSSLYVLRVSPTLRLILAIDEDPIFEQIIFTLFRVVNREKCDRAYTSIAESLYQELRHQATEAARI